MFKKKRRIYLFETFWFICYPLLVATSVFLFSLVAFFNFLTVGISQCYVPSHFFTSCVYQCLQLYLLRTPEFKQIQNWTISLSSFLLEFLFLVSDVLRFWLTWYNQTSFQNTSYLLKALQIICQRLRIVHITKVKRPRHPRNSHFLKILLQWCSGALPPPSVFPSASVVIPFSFPLS